uniref:Uncharacterized protein n=1 Tax=Rhizophora mucronata TaxID=61149 RepID=A0A2P2N416_RHIMU
MEGKSKKKMITETNPHVKSIKHEGQKVFSCYLISTSQSSSIYHSTDTQILSIRTKKINNKRTSYSFTNLMNEERKCLSHP